MRKIIAIILSLGYVIALVAFSSVGVEYKVNFDKEKWDLVVKSPGDTPIEWEFPTVVAKPEPINDTKWELKNGTLTVRGIGEFSECFNDREKEQIKTVILEEGITGVDYNTFWRCENLKTVVLPSTIEKLDLDAFCCDIDTVYYNGSKEDKFQIKIHEGNGVTAAKWIYSNGETNEDVSCDVEDFFATVLS